MRAAIPAPVTSATSHWLPWLRGPVGHGLYADILAIEPSGRPAVIEVRLASNPQARSDIVSQLLAYAAFLQGHTVRTLEQGPLRRSLQNIGQGSILEAVKAQDEEGAVDDDSFETTMQDFLDRGSFRLVLDEVPAEL